MESKKLSKLRNIGRNILEKSASEKRSFLKHYKKTKKTIRILSYLSLGILAGCGSGGGGDGGESPKKEPVKVSSTNSGGTYTVTKPENPVAISNMDGVSSVQVTQTDRETSEDQGIISEDYKSVFVALDGEKDNTNNVINGATTLVSEMMEYYQTEYDQSKEKVGIALGVEISEIDSATPSLQTEVQIYKLDIITKLLSRNSDSSKLVSQTISNRIYTNINYQGDSIFSSENLNYILESHQANSAQSIAIRSLFNYLASNEITQDNIDDIKKTTEIYDQILLKIDNTEISEDQAFEIISKNPPGSFNFKTNTFITYLSDNFGITIDKSLFNENDDGQIDYDEEVGTYYTEYSSFAKEVEPDQQSTSSEEIGNEYTCIKMENDLALEYKKLITIKGLKNGESIQILKSPESISIFLDCNTIRYGYFKNAVSNNESYGQQNKLKIGYNNKNGSYTETTFTLGMDPISSNSRIVEDHTISTLENGISKEYFRVYDYFSSPIAESNTHDIEREEALSNLTSRIEEKGNEMISSLTYQDNVQYIRDQITLGNKIPYSEFFATLPELARKVDGITYRINERQWGKDQENFCFGGSKRETFEKQSRSFYEKGQAYTPGLESWWLRLTTNAYNEMVAECADWNRSYRINPLHWDIRIRNNEKKIAELLKIEEETVQHIGDLKTELTIGLESSANIWNIDIERVFFSLDSDLEKKKQENQKTLNEVKYEPESHSLETSNWWKLMQDILNRAKYYASDQGRRDLEDKISRMGETMTNNVEYQLHQQAGISLEDLVNHGSVQQDGEGVTYTLGDVSVYSPNGSDNLTFKHDDNIITGENSGNEQEIIEDFTLIDITELDNYLQNIAGISHLDLRSKGTDIPEGNGSRLTLGNVSIYISNDNPDVFTMTHNGKIISSNPGNNNEPEIEIEQSDAETDLETRNLNEYLETVGYSSDELFTKGVKTPEGSGTRYTYQNVSVFISDTNPDSFTMTLDGKITPKDINISTQGETDNSGNEDLLFEDTSFEQIHNSTNLVAQNGILIGNLSEASNETLIPNDYMPVDPSNYGPGEDMIVRVANGGSEDSVQYSQNQFYIIEHFRNNPEGTNYPSTVSISYCMQGDTGGDGCLYYDTDEVTVYNSEHRKRTKNELIGWIKSLQDTYNISNDTETNDIDKISIKRINKIKIEFGDHTEPRVEGDTLIITQESVSFWKILLTNTTDAGKIAFVNGIVLGVPDATVFFQGLVPKGLKLAGMNNDFIDSWVEETDNMQADINSLKAKIESQYYSQNQRHIIEGLGGLLTLGGVAVKTLRLDEFLEFAAKQADDYALIGINELQKAFDFYFPSRALLLEGMPYSARMYDSIDTINDARRGKVDDIAEEICDSACKIPKRLESKLDQFTSFQKFAKHVEIKYVDDYLENLYKDSAGILRIIDGFSDTQKRNLALLSKLNKFENLTESAILLMKNNLRFPALLNLLGDMKYFSPSEIDDLLSSSFRNFTPIEFLTELAIGFERLQNYKTLDSFPIMHFASIIRKQAEKIISFTEDLKKGGQYLDQVHFNFHNPSGALKITESIIEALYLNIHKRLILKSKFSWKYLSTLAGLDPVYVYKIAEKIQRGTASVHTAFAIPKIGTGSSLSNNLIIIEEAIEGGQRSLTFFRQTGNFGTYAEDPIKYIGSSYDDIILAIRNGNAAGRRINDNISIGASIREVIGF